MSDKIPARDYLIQDLERVIADLKAGRPYYSASWDTSFSGDGLYKTGEEFTLKIIYPNRVN